jgi:hypothetical protein
MANYTKSFNFRNGVQVDDTNFIVNANGLVGIGTSIPREILDVHGNTKIVGLLSATRIYTEDINVLRSGSNSLTVGIVSISSGIITATSGIITYYGDGGNLINLPTSQWIDVDSGFGYTSIYASGNVGIATTFPNYTLQIGGNPSIHNGIGINSRGSIVATGIVTANKFVGIGSDLTLLDASNISSGTLSNSRLPSIISVGGSISAGTGIYGDTLNIAGNITANDISADGNLLTNLNATSISSGTLNNSRLPSDITVSGTITAASLSGSGTNITAINASNISSGTLNNSRLPSNINISGIITATRINGSTLTLSQNINAPSGIVTANKFIGIGSELTLLDASNISSGTLNNSRLPSDISVSGTITASNGFAGNIAGNVTGNVIGDLTGTASLANNLTGSPAIVVSNINSNFSNLGVSTLTSAYVQNSIGVGTLSPNATVHIRKTSSPTSLQITSDADESYITIGSSESRLGSNGEIKYGNISGIYPYSSSKTLDIINYSLGNINQYLHLGTLPGIGTGNFNWIYGQTNNILLTLTYEGKMGIGVTDPINTFEVVGTSTVTNNSYVGNDFSVSGNATIGGNLTINGSLSSQGAINSDVAGTLTGNVNSTSGISTFNDVNTISLNVTNYVGIGTTTDGGTPLKINKGVNARSFIVSTDGSIGIQTSEIQDNTILTAISGSSVFLSVGVGTTALRSSADFANAGGPAGINYNFMILPKVTTTERDNFTGVTNGSIIYNTTTNKFQGYAAGSWIDLH